MCQARRFALPNGGRSSMAELQVVVLAVAGSSPVDHPITPTPQSETFA